jgi:hypothetical protein
LTANLFLTGQLVVRPRHGEAAARHKTLPWKELLRRNRLCEKKHELLSAVVDTLSPAK